MDQLALVENLERVLIDLYPNQGALERLLNHAKLTVTEFDFSGEYDAALNRCLRKAEGLNKIEDVVRAALRDYPNNDGLKGLADNFDLERPIATSIATSAEELRGFLVLLRRSRHLTRGQFNKLDAGLQRTFDLTTIAESRRQDEGALDQWDDLDQNLKICVRQLQLYHELLDASMKPTRRRVPGASDERVPLAELAADKITLLDAKLQLLDALTAVVQSAQDTD
jgi:hypothetical protein